MATRLVPKLSACEALHSLTEITYAVSCFASSRKTPWCRIDDRRNDLPGVARCLQHVDIAAWIELLVTFVFISQIFSEDSRQNSALSVGGNLGKGGRGRDSKIKQNLALFPRGETLRAEQEQEEKENNFLHDSIGGDGPK